MFVGVPASLDFFHGQSNPPGLAFPRLPRIPLWAPWHVVSSVLCRQSPVKLIQDGDQSMPVWSCRLVTPCSSRPALESNMQSVENSKRSGYCLTPCAGVFHLRRSPRSTHLWHIYIISALSVTGPPSRRQHQHSQLHINVPNSALGVGTASSALGVPTTPDPLGFVIISNGPYCWWC